MIDFKWHRTSQSPNWAILQVDEYINTAHLPINDSNMTIVANPDWISLGPGTRGVCGSSISVSSNSSTNTDNGTSGSYATTTATGVVEDEL